MRRPERKRSVRGFLTNLLEAVAIVTSGVSRMRPVMMAALTFATVLTLIVVPVLYAIFHRVPPRQ